MSVDTAPFDALFDRNRADRSIWHALPRGLHAFGLLAPPSGREPTSGAFEATDTSGSTDDRVGRTHRPPALAHGTMQAILADALTLWVEGTGLSRASFHRVDWRWWPTHVAGVWEAPGVRIALRVAMIEGDDAVIDVEITNTAGTPLEAEIIVRGDDNYITMCRSNVHGLKGEWSFSSGHGVVVTKHPQLAEEMEYFPYSGVLPDDDPKFEFNATHYQFAFSLADGPWRQEGVVGSNGFETWQMRRPMRINPGDTQTLAIGFAGYWSGSQEVADEVAGKLAQRAEIARQKAFGDAISVSRHLWRDLLATAPTLKGDWPAEWVALYYKAWVTVWADLVPPVDFGGWRTARPVVTCLRIGDTMFSNPASWEGALGALLLSLADGKLGCECMEAIYDTTEEDGYISETLGCRRGTALACVEPWIAWACYRQSGDKDFLRRIWERVRKNLAYRLHFPVFKHGTVFNLRNYAYCNISARAAMKIGLAIECPAEELAQVQQMVTESERIVHAFWNEERGCHHASIDPNERAGGPAAAFADGTDAATLVALLGVARPNERQRMVEFCRREYLLETGLLRRSPAKARAATGGHKRHLVAFSEFSLKESEHLAVLKGIKDVDRDLFEKVARGTVANIAADGDFWECMTLDGRGQHNGPGSIFGAFAVIWSLLLMENQVDHLYE